MKIYDAHWYLKYAMNYSDITSYLKDLGVDFVIAQCRYLPMANSAVISEVDPSEAIRYNNYSDEKFREALDKAGIKYFVCCNVGFDPISLALHPEWNSVDQHGEPAEQIDWYIGTAPDRAQHIEQKTAQICKAIKKLQPDGVHLGFMRWPGFWELWVKGSKRSQFSEYCFSKQTLARFATDCDLALPYSEGEKAACWIYSNAHPQWVNWKCKVVTEAVETIRNAILTEKNDALLILNTLPFVNGEFDNAGEEVFGQRLEDLAEFIDVFEVMTYHQILKQNIDWIKNAGIAVKRRTHKTTLCTLQAEAIYLDGVHAAAQRANDISPEELQAALNTVQNSEIDGMVFFTLSDFLEQSLTQDNQRPSELIRSISSP